MARKRVKIAKYTKEKNAEAWRKYREEQAQMTYGTAECMKYVLKDLWQHHRLEMFVVLSVAFWETGRDFCSTFLSKYVVELAIGDSNRVHLAMICMILIILAELFRYGTAQCFNYGAFVGQQKINGLWSRRLLEKNLSVDYEVNEKTVVNNSMNKAREACNMGMANNVLHSLRKTLRAILGIAAFGGILSVLSPWLILIIGIPTAARYYINRHENMWVWNMADNWQLYERQLQYIGNAGGDFRAAKDVRVFGMQRWLEERYHRAFHNRLEWYEQQDAWGFRHAVVSHIVSSVGYFATYAYVIFLVVKGEIGAGDFVLYFSSIVKLSEGVRQLFEEISGFTWLGNGISCMRDYLELKGTANRGEGVPLPQGACEIEFRNVSYTYYGAEEPTIKNVSFKLHKGERLALVGLNGAGKTTLIKLMCGLYDPTEGEILLNGVNIKNYNREEYFRLFSSVFQDLTQMPFSIAENIGAKKEEKIDLHRVYDCMKKADIYDFIMNLPKKENTKLVKHIFDSDGEEKATELSGGQLQKLALAKALYKDASVLLLDEPTSALDPIAEQQMYLNYAEFSKAKSSVFISHRLASTRFCDCILLIEDGRIAEEGTHDELMKLGGKYAELFELQSSYYNEGKEELCFE